MLTRPIATVDLLPFTLAPDGLRLLLQHRDHSPHKGETALAGGYVDPENDINTQASALRVMRKKTGLAPRVLEQLRTFSGPDRDPRGWSISVAYFSFVDWQTVQPEKAKDFHPIEKCLKFKLPFDHHDILREALSRLRKRACYTTLPGFLLPPHFTMSELRRAYATLLNRNINDSAFRRKVDEMRLVQPVEAISKNTNRPAQLFELRSPHVVEFERVI